MKSHVCKTALVILMLSFVSLLGCRTVVTDVNALLGTNESGENLGIPVNYNKDYVEVAYNASQPETEDIVSDTEAKTEEDLDNETTEDKSKDEDDKSDRDADSKDKEESEYLNNESEEDTENEDDSENPDDSKNPDDEPETDEEIEDEENENNDLNASMASDNFDAEFYAATYPDVVAVFGNSPEALYKHYLDYGKAEGRSCNAEEYSLLNESSE